MKFEAARDIAEGTPISAFLAQVDPAVLALMVVLGLMAVFALFGRLKRPRRAVRKGSNVFLFRRSQRARGAGQRIFAQPSAKPDMADPKHQLDAIAKVNFEKTRLLNKEEARLLPVLERAARATGQGYRVMAQTSLGEVIAPIKRGVSSSDAQAAFASINSKRLDFAIFDRFGMLVCAVEYQGSGHHQGKAFMRDAVKKEALRRAGVPLVEVQRNYVPFEVEDIIARILAPSPRSKPQNPTTVHV